MIRKYKKIDCVHCPQYSQCHRSTRFYINYCGGHTADIDIKIERAERDCRTLYGLMLGEELTPNYGAAFQRVPVHG